MRTDTRGVAGFFEDLPVLLLVLAGVSSVALTGAWCTDQQADAARQEGLSAAAEALVRAAVLVASDGGPSTLTVGSLFALEPEDLEVNAAGCVGWAVVIEVLHPVGDRHEISFDGLDDLPPDLGYACELVNAVYEGDMTAVVEVTGVAW